MPHIIQHTWIAFGSKNNETARLKRYNRNQMQFPHTTPKYCLVSKLKRSNTDNITNINNNDNNNDNDNGNGNHHYHHHYHHRHHHHHNRRHHHHHNEKGLSRRAITALKS